MKTFQVNDKIEIVCEAQNTRYGFRHLATLLYNGREADKAKCCYYNRTWERYEFQSVLEALADKTTVLSEAEKKLLKNYIEAYQENDSFFKTVAMVAKMGEFLTTNQKESNDWKARMLKAGLADKGLVMPEDWDSLDEATKEKRLNGAIALLK